MVINWTNSPPTSLLYLHWIDGEVFQNGTAFTLGERLRTLLEGGGCAAIVCNTVRRALRCNRFKGVALSDAMMKSQLAAISRFDIRKRDVLIAPVVIYVETDLVRVLPDSRFNAGYKPPNLGLRNDCTNARVFGGTLDPLSFQDCEKD